MDNFFLTGLVRGVMQCFGSNATFCGYEIPYSIKFRQAEKLENYILDEKKGVLQTRFLCTVSIGKNIDELTITRQIHQNFLLSTVPFWGCSDSLAQVLGNYILTTYPSVCSKHKVRSWKRTQTILCLLR